MEEKIITKYDDLTYKIYNYQNNFDDPNYKTHKRLKTKLNNLAKNIDDSIGTVDFEKDSYNNPEWQNTPSWLNPSWLNGREGTEDETNIVKKTKPTKKDGLEEERKRLEEALKKLEKERRELEELTNILQEARKKLEEEKAKVRAELEKEFQEKLKKAKEALVPRRPHMENLLV